MDSAGTDSYRLTLKSHAGKALVLSEKKDEKKESTQPTPANTPMTAQAAADLFDMVWQKADANPQLKDLPPQITDCVRAVMKTLVEELKGA